MSKSWTSAVAAMALACSALVSTAALPGIAQAQQMSSLDRRLNVAVVGFELNAEAAEDALQAGADINHRNEAMDNDTMLITAIRSFKDLSVVKWLLDKGADPSLTNDLGRTALSYAKQYRIGNTPAGRAIMKLLEGGKAAAPAAAASPAEEAPAEAAEGAPTLAAAQRGIDPITGRGFAEPPPSSKGVAGPPPSPGVYQCHGQSAMISPMTFGIIDGSNYMNSNGKRGRYTYSAASGLLTLDPGRAPVRFQRISGTTFRALHPTTGQLTAFVCPLNKAKNPQRPPW